ncbi:inward rectifier potassium channel family protein [Sphingomonas sp. BN140010]|uniref:Inward rectifier potassium channel family protein n=1 Tax=Sphingomonas arvum TaxID=2992113 RepID=A0ABT3JDT0_9SPHN|nr:inward rectifier potassium channel family protein [Sphingomonas sp. BN140010]MCW3797222.1 inward rectifier potassium channel family protein [Sphingomonas sp. BN140010]
MLVPRQATHQRWLQSLQGDLYHKIIDMSGRRLLVCFIGSFSALNLFFAALYSLDPNGLGGTPNFPLGARYLRAFFFSVDTLATVGYGNVYPVSLYANILAVVEVAVGLLYVALLTGCAFARFSRPTALIAFSESVSLITRPEGAVLTIHAANQRSNTLFDASVAITLIPSSSDEGCIPHELSSVRSTHPAFTRDWTIRHVIEPDSAGGRLLMSGDEPFTMLVVLSGTDNRTGQRLFGLKTYRLDEINRKQSGHDQ